MRVALGDSGREGHWERLPGAASGGTGPAPRPAGAPAPGPHLLTSVRLFPSPCGAGHRATLGDQGAERPWDAWRARAMRWAPAGCHGSSGHTAQCAPAPGLTVGSGRRGPRDQGARRPASPQRPGPSPLALGRLPGCFPLLSETQLSLSRHLSGATRGSPRGTPTPSREGSDTATLRASTLRLRDQEAGGRRTVRTLVHVPAAGRTIPRRPPAPSWRLCPHPAHSPTQASVHGRG